ncbi:MAG: ATP-binding cassette domain-containing protein [Gammaproteobacteria bacterium]|nr:ATP-binding cassette domain-containing protein [Gammaproteobacteria bacterium]
MNDYILELEEFGVAFGEKIILSSVNLKVPSVGNVVLFGPAGIGKSTLFRSICGINYANPSFRTWGKAHYLDQELHADIPETPALVSQNVKLMMSSILENVIFNLPERSVLQKNQQIDIASRLLEQANLADLVSRLDDNVIDLSLGQQRHIAILRTAVANPKLICIDEPTTGLEDDYVDTLLQYISEVSERRAVMTILHNQAHAKKLKGMVALLSGGWIHEYDIDDEFYNAPKSKAGKQFIKSGSCATLGPEVDKEALEYIDLDTVEMPPPLPKAAKQYVSEALGPRNFIWLKKGILAGTPQPGIMTDLDYDLKALKRVGVTKLITLLEKPLDAEYIKQFDIECMWFPINDMEAPTIEDAMKWCQKVEDYIKTNEVTAYHCKAGMGRTGTMLTAQLIWEGLDSLTALENARKIEPRWVQSDVQAKFLEEFHQAVKNVKTSKKISNS